MPYQYLTASHCAGCCRSCSCSSSSGLKARCPVWQVQGRGRYHRARRSALHLHICSLLQPLVPDLCADEQGSRPSARICSWILLTAKS